jgi:hypothetical protein
MKAARPPGLLVLAVLALHLLLGQQVSRIHEGWVSEGPPPMPPRLKVAFVTTMTLQAPPAARPAPPRPPAQPAAQAPEAGTQPAAKEPVQAVTSAASAPEPVPQPPATPVPAVPEPAVAPEAITAAASAPDAAEPGPEWPLSTRLSYALTGNYRGPVYGQAQVEWLRKGSEYQVNLDVGIGPSFAPLITRRLSSQGVLTPAGIAPQRYDEETRFLIGERRRISVFFLGGEVQLASGVREPAQRGAQDSASQFVQLTWLFLTGREPLQAGRVVTFPLVLPRRQALWPYEVLGEELLDTPMGLLPTWHLKPRPAAAPGSNGELNAEVWLAPTLQYLPVRILIRQDADTFVDLMLKGAPLQAAPESKDTSRRPLP